MGAPAGETQGPVISPFGHLELVEEFMPGEIGSLLEAAGATKSLLEPSGDRMQGRAQ